jgi:hypothetical protein
MAIQGNDGFWYNSQVDADAGNPSGRVGNDSGSSSKPITTEYSRISFISDEDRKRSDELAARSGEEKAKALMKWFNLACDLHKQGFACQLQGDFDGAGEVWGKLVDLLSNPGWKDYVEELRSKFSDGGNLPKLEESLSVFKHHFKEYCDFSDRNPDVYKNSIYYNSSAPQPQASTSGVTIGKDTNQYGETYEGEYVNGLKHGKGKLTFSDGRVYEGDFVNGKFHGKGKIIDPNGGGYEGDFADGYMNGKGKYIYSDGRIYIGDLVKQNFHGKGKMTHPDGRIEEGRWENDEFKG